MKSTLHSIKTHHVNSKIVVIVGFGWVGQANALAVSQLGFTVAYFDIKKPKLHFLNTRFANLYKKIIQLENILELDSNETTYVVCVGDSVNKNGKQDISRIEQALKYLDNVKGTVVLRSTITPIKLSTLKFDYYYPEFLHEKYAVEECLKPVLFVLGKHALTKKRLPEVISIFKKSSFKTYVGTPEEAAYIKYLSNTWNALRIAFVNEFGNGMRQKNSFSVEQVNSVLNFFFEKKSYLKYGKYYDGHCLPKDVRAMVNHNKPYNHILKNINLSNEQHRNSVQENLPQWFSKW